MCCEFSVRLVGKQQHLRLYEGPQGTLGPPFPTSSTFTGSYIFSRAGFKSQKIPVKSYNSRESSAKKRGVWLSRSEGKRLII